MKAQDIFCLIVRLSGYFTLFFAVQTIVMMVIGPAPFAFKSLFLAAVYGALGVAIMKLARAIGMFSYGDEPAS